MMVKESDISILEHITVATEEQMIVVPENYEESKLLHINVFKVF